MRRFTILLAAALLCTQVSAQNKEVVKADKLMETEQFALAAQAYSNLSKDKSLKDMKGELLMKAGQAYVKGFNYTMAIRSYEQAIAAGCKDPKVYFEYAEALRCMGKLDDAITQYNNYLGATPGDPLALKKIEEIRKFKADQEKQTRIKVSPFTKFSTKFNDYGANFYKKNTIVFVSKKEEISGKQDPNTGEKFSDLFESTMNKNGTWSAPTALQGAINSEFNEGPACFTKNGTQAYFSTGQKNLNANLKIYVSKRSGNAWEAPEEQRFFKDTTNRFDIANPYLSPDNKTIYFVAENAPGGYGGKDIWMAKRKGNGWEEPVNLGPTINTENDENFPVLTENGELIYASRGLAGYGGYDLFRTKMENGQWTSPKNLGAPLNSASDDIYLIANPSFTKGFLSSNRPGTKGGFDIFEWEQTPLEFNVLVTVLDDTTHKNLPGATVKLFTLPDSSFREMITDENGQITFKLKSNTAYAIVVNKDKYFGNSASVTTVSEEFSKNFERTIGIAPIPPQTIVLEDILYKLADSSLLPQSETSLNILVDLMRKTPNLKIGIYSHTDYRNTDEANQKLSEARARSVVNYLIKNGIDSARLTSKGFGESKPYVLMINGKATILTEAFIKAQPADKQEYYNQLNRRTEFEVLSSDFEGNIKYRRVSGKEDENSGGLFEGRSGGEEKKE